MAETPPNANDDFISLPKSDAAGDIDGNVRGNDTNPSGPALPVHSVGGSTTNVGEVVAGSDGGTFKINQDGSFDFDAAGAFDDLAAGETRTTSITYAVKFTGAADVVDVVLLQDLSGSFGDDLPNVRSQFSGLHDSLNEVRDVQFGVASFVDKPFSPFGGSGDYVYETELAVTGDKAAVQAELDSLVLRWGNDEPESQLEGLLQLALRANAGEIGFRDGAQRIVVLTTDATYHDAGDYAGGDPNNGDAVIDDEDYPTIALLKAALEAADITPVFSVTSNVLALYQDLVEQLGRGVVVQLSSNSSNLSAAITDALTTGVETIDTATLTVTVTGEGGVIVEPPPPDCPIVIRPNTINGSAAADQVLAGIDGPNTFYVSATDDTGQDTIANFGSSDIFVTNAKLFDGNNDGFVSFGSNGVLNMDSSLPGGGDDTVAFTGVDAGVGLRYLGESCVGVHVYAEGTVRPVGAKESLLGDSSLIGDAADAAKDVFFFDTALRLDLGNDKIDNFGAGDLLVTTTKISDSNNDGVIDFGSDKTLNLAFGTDVEVNGKGLTKLEFDGAVISDGVEYFVYSRVGSAVGVADVSFTVPPVSGELLVA